jgi:XTP/dITP diphosphohydrolase
MNKLLLATNNQGKVIEYQYLLQGINFELVTPASLGLKMDVEESGTTYQENARLKAVALAKPGGLLTLADDSGLEVDALNGEPGLRSSRYAGEGATDSQRVQYLLNKLKDVPPAKRTARFVCVIALAFPEGKVEYCRGECQGIITSSPVGEEGFGYDPIFYFPELKKTMAELPREIKNSISHRARAAQQAVKLLKALEFDK